MGMKFFQWLIDYSLQNNVKKLSKLLLVAFSMEVYVEKLIVSEPTMTALAAKDTHFTSAPTSSDLALNTDNNSSKKVLTQLYSETSFCDERSAGTSYTVTNHIAHPMDNGDNDRHHDCQ